MRFKYLFETPKEGETWRDFSIREQAAYKLRRDELRLAEQEGCDCDIDIEMRLKMKGLK